MQISDIPAKFVLPFADEAGLGYIRTIPTDPTGTLGQASLKEGFPAANFNPVSAGGVPPFGQDFNGLLNQATGWNRWQATGMFPPYDPTWQSAVGGYPQGSLVQSLVTLGLVWFCLVDDNITNPDTGGAGWIAWGRISLSQNVDIYVNPSTGSDTLYNGSSPTVSGSNGPFQTITKALAYVGQFAPGTFGVTVNLAAGTYSSSVGFSSAVWAHCPVTFNGAGASTILSATGTATGVLTIQGPNNYTLQNFAFQSTSTYTGGPGGIRWQGGATVTLNGGITALAMPANSAVFYGAQGILSVQGNVTLTGPFTGTTEVFTASGSGSIIGIGSLSVINITISAPVTVLDFIRAANGGYVAISSVAVPTFTNPGNVTGQKYAATLNGIINTWGQGVNYFPGSVAGSTSGGGQYG